MTIEPVLAQMWGRRAFFVFSQLVFSHVKLKTKDQLAKNQKIILSFSKPLVLPFYPSIDYKIPSNPHTLLVKKGVSEFSVAPYNGIEKSA